MANQDQESIDDFARLMRLAEMFTDATLKISEASGLQPFHHAISIAVAAEHAQITLRKQGLALGATEADWAEFEKIRESVVASLRESARAAAEKARVRLG